MDVLFEWDIKKASKNEAKHKINFEESSTVFNDPLACIFDDPIHSLEENREIIIGHSISGMLLVVCFTERRKDTVRIISARKASRKERKDYENYAKFQKRG